MCLKPNSWFFSLNLLHLQSFPSGNRHSYWPSSSSQKPRWNSWCCSLSGPVSDPIHQQMLPIQSSDLQNPTLLTMDVLTTANLGPALALQGPPQLFHDPTACSPHSQHWWGSSFFFLIFIYVAALGLSCTTQDLSLWHMGLAAPRHVES